MLLFMSSMVCLLIASESSFIDQRVIFWVLGSVALAFLGIDERFSFHERTEGFLINDDHIKLVLWVICSGALLQICRMETKDRNVILLFCLGYFFHAMYLVVQLGDGDYFRLPYFSKSVLRWMEEMFELTMLTLYFSALLSIYTGRRRVVH